MSDMAAYQAEKRNRQRLEALPDMGCRTKSLDSHTLSKDTAEQTLPGRVHRREALEAPPSYDASS